MRIAYDRQGTRAALSIRPGSATSLEHVSQWVLGQVLRGPGELAYTQRGAGAPATGEAWLGPLRRPLSSPEGRSPQLYIKWHMSLHPRWKNQPECQLFHQSDSSMGSKYERTQVCNLRRRMRDGSVRGPASFSKFPFLCSVFYHLFQVLWLGTCAGNQTRSLQNHHNPAC